MNEYGALVEWYWQGKNEWPSEKTLPVWFRPSRMLRNVDWCFVIDFSAQNISFIFKGQSVQEEDEADSSSRNVGKEQPLYAQ